MIQKKFKNFKKKVILVVVAGVVLPASLIGAGLIWFFSKK